MPTWIIACKHEPGSRTVFNCVASIREHHPDGHIVVVDSKSRDLGYLFVLQDQDGVDSIAGRNTHYAPGAYQIGMDHNPDETFFYLLHDSTLIHDNLDDLATRDFTTLRWFDSRTTGWGWDQDSHGLDEWAAQRDVLIPPTFEGILGPILFARRDVIEKADLFRLLPTTAYEQCALERCWGIWLQQAGYNPSDSCLQGEMRDFFDPYDNTRVEKIIGSNRA